MFTIDALGDLSSRIEKLNKRMEEIEKEVAYKLNELTIRMRASEVANTDAANGLQNVFNEFSKIKYILEIQERPDIENIKKEIRAQVLQDILRRLQ